MKQTIFLPLILLGIAACANVTQDTSTIDNSNSSETAIISDKELKIHEKTFANGMKVIVKEDHRAPVVISQVWYQVGSAQEHSGITGVSHVLGAYDVQGNREISVRHFLLDGSKNWCAR